MLALPTTLRRERHAITELWGAENSFFRMRGNVKRSEGSGMLIGNPLVERSNASSTNNELWRVESELRRSYRSGMLIEDTLR